MDVLVAVLKYGFGLALLVETVVIVRAIALLAIKKARAAEDQADAPHAAGEE